MVVARLPSGVLLLFALAAGCSNLAPAAKAPTAIAAASTQAPRSYEDRSVRASEPNRAMDWRLVWQDEFDGPAGASVDPRRWTFDEGGGGWGNQELQFYTRRAANAALDGEGHLVITARRENYGGREYTSARLKTQGLADFTYGRVEARARVPEGHGIWPAFWMLGSNIASVQWPRCGEIDVMENIGREPRTLHGTIHGPGYSGASGPSGAIDLPAPLAADFHTFSVEWEKGEIRWYVDGKLYSAKTPADLTAGATWVFDHPFFLLLNVAVGGAWPGSPADSTSFPQTFIVDYVRVFQRR